MENLAGKKACVASIRQHTQYADTLLITMGIYNICLSVFLHMCQFLSTCLFLSFCLFVIFLAFARCAVVHSMALSTEQSPMENSDEKFAHLHVYTLLCRYHACLFVCLLVCLFACFLY